MGCYECCFSTPLFATKRRDTSLEFLQQGLFVTSLPERLRAEII